LKPQENNHPKSQKIDMPDEALVELIKKGDKDAGAIIFDRYYSKLVGNITNKLHATTGQLHKETTEEIASDIFSKVFKNIDTYNPKKGPFYGWFWTITSNTYISWLREQANDWKFKPEEGISITNPEEIIFAKAMLNALFEQILDGIAQIASEDLKATVLFRAILEIEYSEIAEILGKNEITIRGYFSRGIKELGVLLESFEYSSSAIKNALERAMAFDIEDCHHIQNQQTKEILVSFLKNPKFLNDAPKLYKRSKTNIMQIIGEGILEILRKTTKIRKVTVPDIGKIKIDDSLTLGMTKYFDVLSATKQPEKIRGEDVLGKDSINSLKMWIEAIAALSRKICAKGTGSSIAQIIYETMTAKGLDMDELCDKAGLTCDMMASYISGKFKIPTKAINKLSKLLKLPAESLKSPAFYQPEYIGQTRGSNALYNKVKKKVLRQI